MFDKFKDLREFFRADAIKIDGFVFGLHYKPTVGFLVAMSVIIVTNWFFSAQISCIFDKSKDYENFLRTAQDYCLLHSVYVVNGPNDVQYGLTAHPGVRQIFKEDAMSYQMYYQWVPFMCMIQAMFFYLPRHIWVWCERGHIHLITQLFDKIVINEEERNNKKKVLVDHIMDYMGNNKFYGYSYLFCEFLNFVNVIGQAYLTDAFLGYEFSEYGFQVMSFLLMDPRNRTDPMSRIFPRVGKCTFTMYGHSGNLVPYDGICVLPSNVLYEKMYVWMWFWFLLVSVFTSINVVHIIATIISKYYRSVRIRWRSPFTNFRKLRFLCKEIQIGDWLLISLIGKNIDPIIYRDVIEDVTVQLEIKKNSKRNRSGRYGNGNRSTGSDFDITYNEISAVAVNVNRNRSCYEESRISAT